MVWMVSDGLLMVFDGLGNGFWSGESLGIVFHALGAISGRFGMDFGSFGDQRSLRMLRKQIFVVCVGLISGFWILPL